MTWSVQVGYMTADGSTAYGVRAFTGDMLSVQIFAPDPNGYNRGIIQNDDKTQRWQLARVFEIYAEVTPEPGNT